MSLKRFFDFIVSLILLLALMPLFGLLSILIFFQDFKSPFYIAPRVGIGGKLFYMIKFRSMQQREELNHIVSTSSRDPRITRIGKLIRKYKIDELSQLINVLLGTMSLVGPRPNVKVEVDLYTDEEKKILLIKPGITDFSSIVFSDLNSFLSNSKDPNLDYNQFIRPWKSRLGIIYVNHSNFKIDILIIILTAISLISRPLALKGVSIILKGMNAPKELVEICLRKISLKSYPPPGSDNIVTYENRY